MAQFPPEVRGRVTATTGGPVAGAEVTVGDGATVVLTDVDGAFVVRGVAPGSTTCHVRRVGFAPESQRVELANGQVTRVAIALMPVPVQLETLESRGGPISADELVDATILDKARIAASGARELGQLLQGEAGVVITQRGGPGSPTTVSIRGSESHQVLVLLDGVPINDPITGTADLSTVPLGSVDRVTVIRGAQSSRYGSQALAGVVLVQTSQPTRSEWEGRVGAGSYGERTAAASAAARGNAGDIDLGGRIGAEWRKVTGDFPYDIPIERGGGSARRANADARVGDVTASGSASRKGVEARVRLEYFDADRGMPGSVVQPSLYARQKQRRYGAVASVKVPVGSWQFAVDGDAQRQRATFADTLPPFGTPYNDSVTVTALRAAVLATGQFLALSTTLGAEYRHTAFSASTLAADAPTSQQQGGVFGSVARSIELSERWRMDLSAGARVDGSSLLGGAFVSPRVAAAIGTDHVTFRGSWGRAFSPPSLADQFFQEGVQVRPNPLLKPERVRDEITLGVDLHAVPLGPLALDLAATVFRADVSGMILWFPDFRFIWQPDNFDVRRRGAELSTRLSARPARLTFSGTVAATRVEYAGPVLSGQVIYRPVWTAAARVSATVAAVDADLAWRYTGGRRTGVGSDLNTLTPFQLVDVHAARMLVRGAIDLQLRAGLENLFNRRAAMLIDYPFAGRIWTVALRLRRGSPS